MAEQPQSSKEVAVNKLFVRFSSQIEALQNELKVRGVASNMSLAQRLPRHLRRRAASHNPKRVPRSVRGKFAEARAKATETENKRKPCRRYRRKPSNLRAVYLRRQARVRWLQTHIWHAKRFHIVERWGWRLPNYANDKGRKASIRALKSEVIMMDVSFSSIIELAGPRSSLVNLLSKFIPEPLGRPFAQKSFWTGTRHCSALLYDPDKIYPLGALGHCSVLVGSDSTESSSKIWLSAVHPLLVITLLAKLATADSDCLVKAEDVSDQVCSFRCFGPRTHSMLALALNLKEKQISDQPAGFFDQEVIDDPRPRIPVKIRPISSLQACRVEPRNTSKASGMPSLFDSTARSEANKSRISDHLVSSRKAVADCQSKLAKVPIILVRSAHFYDVIVPSQWATAFWISFVYNGARTGGLRELESLSGELASFAGSFQLGFFPDCKMALENDSRRVENELFAAYLRRPPAKRVSYRKLAILRPFHCPWQELIQFWLEESAFSASFAKEFCVLREFSVLREIAEDVSRKLELRRELVVKHPHALLPVQISAKDGGTPQQFGLICLPPRENAGKQENEEPIHSLDPTLIPCDSNDPSFTFRLNSLKIIGFFVQGGYSFVRGHGLGLGFVSLIGLSVLLKCRGQNLVQFRATSERKYWPGRLEIVTNAKL